jgi:hypothetical protein
MQKPQITSTFGHWKASLFYGLLFGGIIGLLDVLYIYYQDTWNADYFVEPVKPQLTDIFGGMLFYLPLYIFLLLCFFLAGYLTTRRTQHISSGRRAGLIVGGVFLLVDVLVGNLLLDYLVAFPQLAHEQLASLVPLAESYALIGGLSYSGAAGLILIGVGALMGALGGQVRKWGVFPGRLAVLSIGAVLLLGSLFVGGLILMYLIVVPQLAPDLQPVPDLASAESALVVAGLASLIGAGALIGAISTFVRRKRDVESPLPLPQGNGS